MEGKVQVKFGEPVSPLVFYEEIIKNKKFNFRTLEKLLNKFEEKLDNIYERFDDKISMFDYRIVLMNENNKKNVEFVIGMIDLSVEEGRKYGLPDFKKRYKEAFKTFLGKKENFSNPLYIEVSVVGFRDKITSVVDAKDPKSAYKNT